MSSRTTNVHVLRVGVLVGGRLIEERVLRPRESLTIGSARRNIITLPGAGLPDRLPLIIHRQGRYRLLLPENLELRLVEEGGQVLDGDGARGAGKRLPDGRHTIPLTPNHRGKITIGDHALLFQFVRPPPRMPRRAFRIPIWRRVDALLWLCFIASALLHTGVLVHARAQPRPAPITIEQIIDRFPELATIHFRPLPKKGLDEKDPKPTPATVKTDLADIKDHPDQEMAVAMVPREQQNPIESRLNRGIMKMLRTRNLDGNSLFGGHTIIGTDDLLGRAGRILQCCASGIRPSLRQGDDQASDLGNTIVASTRMMGNIALGSKIQRARPPVLEAPVVEDGAAPNDLGATLRRYMPAVTACYERALKLNPRLSGKYYLDLRVADSGRVSQVDIRAAQGATDPGLEACLQKRVIRWRFHVLTEGPLELTIPVILTPRTAI